MKNETMKLSTTEQNIDRAIQRVVAAYGTDLSAFYLKFQKQAKASDSPKSKKPDTTVQRPTKAH